MHQCKVDVDMLNAAKNMLACTFECVSYSRTYYISHIFLCIRLYSPISPVFPGIPLFFFFPVFFLFTYRKIGASGGGQHKTNVTGIPGLITYHLSLRGVIGECMYFIFCKHKNWNCLKKKKN